MPYLVPPDTTQEERSLTVAQAAALLSCDPSTVRRLLKKGDISGHRIGKDGVRVFASSIAAYQRQHAIIPDAAPENRPSRDRPASPGHLAAIASLRAQGLL
jgi:excisionase family DNA binding protein